MASPKSPGKNPRQDKERYKRYQSGGSSISRKDFPMGRAEGGAICKPRLVNVTDRISREMPTPPSGLYTQTDHAYDFPGLKPRGKPFSV